MLRPVFGDNKESLNSRYIKEILFIIKEINQTFIIKEINETYI